MQFNGGGYNIMKYCFDFQYQPLDYDILVAQILCQNFKLKYPKPYLYNGNIKTCNDFFSSFCPLNIIWCDILFIVTINYHNKSNDSS